MKLKNLLIASLALLSFASCSKDDTVEPEKPVVPVDAVVSFLVKADAVTKASEEGKAKENFVNTLDAYVFNAKTGSLVGHSRREGDKQSTLTQIDSILIKILPNKNGTSDDEFKLVVLANIKDPGINSLSELSAKALTDSIGKYTIGSILPMNSKVISFTGVKPTVKDVNGKYMTNNWVGNTGSVRSTATEGTATDREILLNRMVARVQVESITMDIDTRYPGASFELDTISMINVRTHATLPSNGSLEALGFGDNFVKGYQSANFVPEATKPGGVIKDPSDIVNTLWESYTFISRPTYTDAVKDPNSEVIFDDSKKDLSSKNFYCYVFPNADATYKTALLISGYFKRYANDPRSLKHFMVTLSDGNNSRVLANNIYKLIVTLNGEGSTDENHPEITAGVSVKIEVAPWNVIDQVEEDKN